MVVAVVAFKLHCVIYFTVATFFVFNTHFAAPVFPSSSDDFVRLTGR